MTDDKAVEAALDAWWADAQNDNATGVTAMRAALAAANKVRAERLQDDCGDEIGKLRMALAKGEAERAALVAFVENARDGNMGCSHTKQIAAAETLLALVRKGV